MNYHNITTDDMLNGDGLRVVLWTAGCLHKCKGCQNPCTWNPNDGIPFDKNAEEEIYTELSKKYISGLTLSGGDPLHPSNIDTCTRLAKQVKEIFPNKTIWLYSGSTWEEANSLEIMKYIDVFVDGEFILDKRDITLPWKGSSNQRVIDVKKSSINNIVLH